MLERLLMLAVGDLGVQRGMAAHAGKDVSKLKGKGGKWKYMSEKDMLEISEKFSPYRYVCLLPKLGKRRMFEMIESGRADGDLQVVVYVVYVEGGRC